MEQIFLIGTGVPSQGKHSFPRQLKCDGRISSSKRTKHVRYYFVSDRITKGELQVQWCPTNDMIADYMTKPLQGKLFRRFRDLIMGLKSPSGRIVEKDEKTCLAVFPVDMIANEFTVRNLTCELTAVRIKLFDTRKTDVSVSIFYLGENNQKEYE
jgi:hypothetical protein